MLSGRRLSEPERRLGSLYRTAVLLLSAALLAGCSAAAGITDMTASAGRGMFGSGGADTVLPIQMFVVSTRKEKTSRPASPEGARFALDTISVPGSHQPGAIELPTFGSAKAGRDFLLSGAHGLDPDEFDQQIGTYLSGRTGSNRDVLLYVHGFNTSLDDARFRLAQIVADARFGGVPVLFTWPSQANMFSYVSDKDSATASRDALERLMMSLASAPGVGRVHVLAHSMGAWLAMEALRENAIAGHADLNGKLGDVMLAAPDIDLNVFRAQMARVGESAHVAIFVSSGDRALSLSARLAGARPRVGALDPNNPPDAAELQRLGVKVYDLSAMASGFLGHDTYANAPQVIRAIGQQLAEPREDRDVTAVIGPGALRPVDPAATPGPVTTTPLAPPASAAAGG